MRVLSLHRKREMDCFRFLRKRNANDRSDVTTKRILCVCADVGDVRGALPLIPQGRAPRCRWSWSSQMPGSRLHDRAACLLSNRSSCLVFIVGNPRLYGPRCRNPDTCACLSPAKAAAATATFERAFAHRRHQKASLSMRWS